MSSFGTNFVIVNDICQLIPQILFEDGAAVHHATIKRGLKEYIVFRQASSNKIYIEEVERNKANFSLKKIEEDSEWADLYRFLLERGVLLVNPKEIKLGR